MTRLKGTNLAHTRSYVESTFGPEGWATVLAGVSRESRAALEAVIAVGWYPVSLHIELLAAIDAELDRKQGILIMRAAAYGAEYDFTRIHRVLFRLANPGFLLERVGDIWPRFYDSGRWVITRPTPTSAQCSLSDFGVTNAMYCDYFTGYFERLWALIGARDLKLAHPICRARGASICRFDGSWR